MPDDAKQKQPKSAKDELEETGLQIRTFKDPKGVGGSGNITNEELAVFELILREHGGYKEDPNVKTLKKVS